MKTGNESDILKNVDEGEAVVKGPKDGKEDGGPGAEGIEDVRGKHDVHKEGVKAAVGLGWVLLVLDEAKRALAQYNCN